MSDTPACTHHTPVPNSSPGRYRRRHPERSVLYQAVQENLETFLAQVRAQEETSGQVIPAYVEREFRHYLQCGLLAYGFARAYCGQCGHEFLVAFSCKRRGVCPSCNTRRMAETAAHLVDHVIPPVPVRQWVLSLPKRLRWHLYHDTALASAVLKIFLEVIEQTLHTRSADAPAGARLGAVSFIHRFGASLNPHVHFHCCVTDGVFSLASDGVRFHESQLSEADVRAVQNTIRQRVLHLAKRRGLLKPEEIEAMLGWSHSGGFSVDAQVRIEADDRPGLERLLRYCARPAFALERLAWIGKNHQRLVYRPPKPMPDGRTELVLTPLELLERLAQLIPPPRIHRHRYHGVFAPNAPLREQVTALVAPQTEPALAAAADGQTEQTQRPSHAYLWAMLIARIYETFPLACPNCGAPMRIIAFIIEAAPIRHILQHIGEPHEPPPLHPARGPPDWADDEDPALCLDEDLNQDRYEVEYDQRVSW